MPIDFPFQEMCLEIFIARFWVFTFPCRCGYEFCYTCGAEWKNKKATCSCPLWDEENILEDDFDSDEEDEEDDEGVYFDSETDSDGYL